MTVLKTTYSSTEEMINRLQQLKRKLKFNFFKNITKYYDEMENKSISFEEDPFAKNARGISEIYLEVFFVIETFTDPTSG